MTYTDGARAWCIFGVSPRSPWLWAIAGAVVVGAVAGVGYCEYRQPGDPTKGTLGSGVLHIP
jgi:hypothetical protein